MWNLIYEGNQERINQVVPMILNMEHIPRKSKQQFKIQSYFGIFDPVIVEIQWYYGAASQDLKYMCKLFGKYLILLFNEIDLRSL